MTRLNYGVAIFLLLAPAGAFAQSPTRPSAPGTTCNPAMDYNCPQPKGTGIGIDNSTDANAAANATRLRNETRPPRSSNGPEEPEQPIGQPIEPEAPLSDAH